MKPILWPEPTHGTATGLQPYRTAAEIIDWSIRAPSIFMTKADAKAEGLNIVRPLADKSLARIARGFDRHVMQRARSARGAFVILDYIKQVRMGMIGGQTYPCRRTFPSSASCAS